MAIGQNNKAKLLLLLSLVLLISLSGCAGVEQNNAAWKGSGEWEWMGLGGIALMAMALILALSFMTSSLLGDEQMRAWTKREVAQLAYSAFIFACVIALVVSVDGLLKTISIATTADAPAWNMYVTTSVCCNPATERCNVSPALANGRPCHIALAMDYLQILFESGRKMGETTLWNYYLFALISPLTISVSSPMLLDLVSVDFRPFSIWTIDSQFYGVIFDFTFKTMMFIRMQQTFLDFLWGAVVPMMLGIGLALRAFHFSRKMGGMLIALALSVYIVMPMFYVLLSGILFGFMSDWTNRGFGNTVDASLLPEPMPDGMGLSLNPGAQNETVGSRTNVMDLCGTATAAQKNGQESQIKFLAKTVMATWNSAPGDAMDIGGRFGIDGPASNLAMLMVFTLVTPFIGLMTMLASFKYFSPLIGGDVELALLSRLI